MKQDTRTILDLMISNNYTGGENDEISSHPTTLLYSMSSITDVDINYLLSLSDSWPFMYYLTDYSVVGFHRLFDKSSGKWYNLIPIDQLIPDKDGLFELNDENSLFAKQIDTNTTRGSLVSSCIFFMNNTFLSV